MSTQNVDENVPEQETGSQTDTHHSVDAKDITEAREKFTRAKQRLQDINNWDKICGKASAIFRLTDNSGNEVNRQPQQGDHFKINVPAPGNEAGHGFDWVLIEEISDGSNPDGDTESFVMRVRPSSNPQNPDEETAHFFKNNATSSFAVERENTKVTASVHGRNELPNTKTESVLDKARNAIVALGAMIGISTPQWKSLVKGVLED
jgi:hypothetical protein